MQGSDSKRGDRAFTLIELLLVLAVLAIIVAMLLPGLLHYPNYDMPYCANNLKQIGLSFRTWSTDNNDRFPMRALTNRDGSLETASGTNVFRIFQAMSNEVNNPKILVCPQDNRQPVEDFSTLKNFNISYFVGLDADETMPDMILTGDRNLVANGKAVGPGPLIIGSSVTVGWSGQIHKSWGNIGLADGSVRPTTSADLQALPTKTGTNVIRLAIP